MALVNNELVGEESSIPYQGPNVPIGIFLEQRFQENITTYGDAKWLVIDHSENLNYFCLNRFNPSIDRRFNRPVHELQPVGLFCEIHRIRVT